VTMPTSPESSIFDSAALVMLHGGARPNGVFTDIDTAEELAPARSLASGARVNEASR